MLVLIDYCLIQYNYAKIIVPKIYFSAYASGHVDHDHKWRARKCSCHAGSRDICKRTSITFGSFRTSPMPLCPSRTT